MATYEGKCTFQWEIRNLQYFWLRVGESMKSATFFIDKSTLTKWSLILYPKGKVTENHVSVYLQREKIFADPETIAISFQIAILDKGGSVLKVKNVSKMLFREKDVSGVEDFVTRAEIFGNEKEKLCPQDIVVLQCTLFIENKVPLKAIYPRAFTNLKTNNRSFYWKINGFSSLKPKEMNRFFIYNVSEKQVGSFALVSGPEGEITLEIYIMHESLKFFSFHFSVIDSKKKRVEFGSHIFFECNTQRIERQLISKEQLMLYKNIYFPNDVLFLECEYTFSNESLLHTIEKIDFGIISPIFTEEPIENKNISKLFLNMPHPAQTLVDDLKSMYSDAVLCDIEIRTSTKTFPAHKNILSARSPVFRRMFSNDMKEKNSGHVDITDLEEDTVSQMLTYIYTDSLGDLQFESASKLYSAADKYEILSLKDKCSCFLKENMCPTNACDLLILADRHQDEDLKCAVQDYILSHDKEVFGLQEWKDFMTTNLKLAADIMYRKVYPHTG